MSNVQSIDPRQTLEWKARVRKLLDDADQLKKAKSLAILLDQMKVGWTDRGIKRQMVNSGLYKADDSRVQALIDEARAECRVADPDPISDNAAVSVIAAPYIWQEAFAIPPRDWLYGHRLLRKFATATVGAGGTIKSTLELGEAIAMASARPLFGVKVPKQLVVWYYNLEDPLEEIRRRVSAICKQWFLSAADLDGYLFINSGRDQPLVIAETTRNGAVIRRPVVDALVEQINEHYIDVLIIDPFVSCHQVTENDNNAFDLVTKEWGRVADRGNCAVELVHHVRKGDAEVTVDSARGGGSFGDACRMVRVINRMTKDEATKAGVDNPRLYFKAYIDKNNLAPPAESADWYKLVSVDLDNNPDGVGDSIGAVVKWDWPDHLAGVTGRDFDTVAMVIKAGKWREHVQAKAWVGVAVARGMELDLGSKGDKAKVKALIKVWIDAGSLIVVEGEDENRVKRVFVEVAADQ
jgi:AAA domain